MRSTSRFASCSSCSPTLTAPGVASTALAPYRLRGEPLCGYQALSPTSKWNHLNIPVIFVSGAKLRRSACDIYIHIYYIAEADASGNTMLQIFCFQTTQKSVRLKIVSYRRSMGKTGGGKVSYLSSFVNAAARSANCRHADQKQAHATIALRSRHRINPRSIRFVSGMTNEFR